MINKWFHLDFKPYVTKKGHKLLRDDYAFIERTIKNMPENKQRDLMRGYVDEWNRGVAGKAQNQNLGRFLANSWLLEKSQ